MATRRAAGRHGPIGGGPSRGVVYYPAQVIQQFSAGTATFSSFYFERELQQRYFQVPVTRGLGTPLLETAQRTICSRTDSPCPETCCWHCSAWPWSHAAAAVVAAAGGANVENIFPQISVFGNTVFLSGEQEGPYRIGIDGVSSVFLLNNIGNGVPPALGPIFRDHFTSAGENRANLFERDVIKLSRVSFDANDLLVSTLRSAPPLSSRFPASQLGAMARTISERGQLGASRQFSSTWAVSTPTPTRRPLTAVPTTLW